MRRAEGDVGTAAETMNLGLQASCQPAQVVSKAFGSSTACVISVALS